ncbi:glycerate kinase [Carboxydothermus islandicus]|uniref:Glycerate kinase n=1 Tax=Carboxydothermus islandicus TaxID=661089 RepID=A0A1L8D450_9THEO|nr:glycerate kinase [Carboxydothermus islandicus]GAV25965.1 glycerate kinase [Carboxydothermus islandicus]
MELIIITGEGATDYQTMFGKVPLGVARLARKFGKSVVCISGLLNAGYEKLYAEGITALFCIVNRPMTLDEAMERGKNCLKKFLKTSLDYIIYGRKGDK